MSAASASGFRTLVTIATVLVATSSAGADDLGPAAILERMDRTINGFADQAMDARMTVVDVDGTRKSYDFSIQQKGESKRLVQFSSGELKGLATLVEDRNRVYVYLPGFKKVRRVAASNMNQSIAGSDFTSEDMATASWTRHWDASLDREDADHWYLRCVPKPDSGIGYGHAIVKVEKARFLQLGIEYFDRSGRKVKTFENTGVRDFHGVPRAEKVVVTDVRSGHRTELEIRDFRVNRNLPEAMFTVRQLEWGVN